MANLNELRPVGKLNPFAKFCCTIGNLPTSYMISLTYEEQLLWLCNYLEDTVIPAVNTNAEAVQELQELYVVLKNYVDNYFENLDVQEEINQKLDEMAENGSLTSIISAYVNPLIQEQNNLINNFITETNNNIEEQNEQISSIEDNTQQAINNQNQEINALNSRVDEITTLPEGSTSGDAELIDIRTGFNGVVYSNARNSCKKSSKK